MKKISILILFVTITLHGFSQLPVIKGVPILSETKLGPVKFPVNRSGSGDTTLISPTFLSAQAAATYANYIAPPNGVGGYLSGTNAVVYEYYEKYSIVDYDNILFPFQIDSPATLDKVYAWIGIRKLGTTPGKVVSHAYSVSYSASANNGQGGYVPGDSLGSSDSLSMVNVIGSASYQLTTFTYSKPVTIARDDSFFVSIVPSANINDTGTAKAGDSIAIATTVITATPPFPNCAYMNFFGVEYVDYTVLIGHDIDLAIFPHLTGIATGINKLNNIDFVSVMPNPAVNEIYIGYDISNNDNVNIKLVDMLGKTVSEVSTKNQSKGTHTEVMNVSSLPAGLYIYNVETTTGTSTGKVLISH